MKMARAGVAMLAAALAAPAAAQAPSAEDLRRSAAEGFFKKADELVNDRNYEATTTAHYKIKTDDPRFDTKQAGQLLESLHAYFESSFAGKLALKPSDAPGRLYLFYSNFKYKKLFEGTLGKADPPPGHYRSFEDVIAIHTDSVSPTTLADVIVHEAAHQLIQRRLVGDEQEPSLWLTEGMAEYFGDTLRDKKGAFVDGEIGPKNVKLLRDAPASSEGAGAIRLKALKAAIRKEQVPDLEGILDAGPSEFYGAGVDLMYAGAWALVHMLMQTETGAKGGGFMKYLEDEAAGNGSPEVFHKDIGMDAATLERRFVEYVDTLKAK